MTTSKDFLLDLIKNSVNLEFVGTIDVPDANDEYEPQNEEWWLRMMGGMPPQPIEAGTYAYIYESDEIEIDTRYDVLVEIGFAEYIRLYKIKDVEYPVGYKDIH